MFFVIVFTFFGIVIWEAIRRKCHPVSMPARPLTTDYYVYTTLYGRMGYVVMCCLGLFFLGPLYLTFFSTIPGNNPKPYVLLICSPLWLIASILVYFSLGHLLWFGPRFTITPKGFIYRSLFRRKECLWSNFGGTEYVRPSGAEGRLPTRYLIVHDDSLKRKRFMVDLSGLDIGTHDLDYLINHYYEDYLQRTDPDAAAGIIRF